MAYHCHVRFTIACDGENEFTGRSGSYCCATISHEVDPRTLRNRKKTLEQFGDEIGDAAEANAAANGWVKDGKMWFCPRCADRKAKRNKVKSTRFARKFIIQ